MTAPGLGVTDRYTPSMAMTAARDRARGVAADRRDALIARDRFTLDPHDDRRDPGLRRTDRPAPASGDAAKPAPAPQAELSPGTSDIGARMTGLDDGATAARDAKTSAIGPGARADRTPAASVPTGGAGSARATAARTGAGSTDGAKDPAATAATATAGSSDPVADPHPTATAVPGGPDVPMPAVPVQPGPVQAVLAQAVLAQAGPAAPSQATAGAADGLDAHSASAKAAEAMGSAIGTADARGGALGGIVGDAKRDGADSDAADGTAFEGVLAQAGDAAAPVAPPPDPAAAGAKVEAAVPARETPAPTPAVPATPPLPLGAVPMTIGLRSLKGSSQFEIRLDPVELGRIDVTLDIDRDSGGASARLVVDRPETLALLQRDADSLQQALAQAGFDPGAAGISLSLRGDGTDGAGGDTGDAGAQARGGGRPAASGTPDADASTAIGSDIRALRRIGGLDIRI